MPQLKDFKTGDFVVFKCEQQECFGEVVEVASDLIVAVLKPKKDHEKVLTFQEERHVTAEDIVKHSKTALPFTVSSVKTSWKQLGIFCGANDEYCILGDETECFIQLHDAETSSEDSDYEPVEEEEETESEGEFTIAESDTSFVDSVHEAVNSWNDFKPKTKGQKRFYDIVNKIEARAIAEQDEIRFTAGKASIDVRHPKRRRK